MVPLVAPPPVVPPPPVAPPPLVIPPPPVVAPPVVPAAILPGGAGTCIVVGGDGGWPTLMMMSPNCDGSFSRPRVLIGIWTDWPGGEGGWPTCPAGASTFSRRIALDTSTAVM